MDGLQKYTRVKRTHLPVLVRFSLLVAANTGSLMKIAPSGATMRLGNIVRTISVLVMPTVL
jgi:hypothetical protein